LAAMGTLAAAVIAFGAFLLSMTKNDVAPAPAITITNTNNAATHQDISGSTSLTIPNVAPAATKAREPSSPTAAVSDYKKYIDSNVHRLAGTTNVAIALRGLPGFPPGALESAVQRALRERGFRIVPIFRNQFREDEAELRLFNGDASFASRLKLQEHCDSVLLGVLRFAGPAQAVDGGMYIREAVLEIRALDPSTGLVIDSLEISEKGGGTTAELSAIAALSRLKESVLANISGWSWV
jgi:ribosomal protein S11